MDKVYSHQIKEGDSSAQVIATDNDGVAHWVGNVVVLIPLGGSVPADTPINAIIVEKAT